MLSRTLAVTSVSILGLCGASAWAQRPVSDNAGLAERVALLESRSTPDWLNRLSWSGAVEVEAGFADQEDEPSSDLVAATVELGLDAQVNDWTSVQVLLLHEEDDTPLEVDEASITLGNSDRSPLYLRAGQFYLPFGRFESHMISDPLTLEVAEIRESALQLGAASKHWYGSVFVFNGSTSEGGDNSIEHFGAEAGVLLEAGEASLDVGAGYLSSLGDSDGLDMDAVDDFAAGVVLHALFEMDRLTLIGEYVMARDDLAGANSQISAMNLELAYSLAFAGQDLTLALGHQQTQEAGPDLPSERLMFALGTTLWADTGLSVEWAQDEFDGKNDTASRMTLQLATSF